MASTVHMRKAFSNRASGLRTNKKGHTDRSMRAICISQRMPCKQLSDSYWDNIKMVMQHKNSHEHNWTQDDCAS